MSELSTITRDALKQAIEGGIAAIQRQPPVDWPEGLTDDEVYLLRNVGEYASRVGVNFGGAAGCPASMARLYDVDDPRGRALGMAFAREYDRVLQRTFGYTLYTYPLHATLQVIG